MDPMNPFNPFDPLSPLSPLNPINFPASTSENLTPEEAHEKTVAVGEAIRGVLEAVGCGCSLAFFLTFAATGTALALFR